MPFDYEANISAVKNALTNANTTTAVVDLSSGLTTRVITIEIDDPEIRSLRNLDYPAVFVRLSNKNEDYETLGGTGPTRNRKKAEVLFDIYGLYHKEGAVTAHKNVLTEIYRLAENIEGVFQQEFTLSGTSLWCNPETTQFSPAFQGREGTWVKACLVELKARYLFR